MDKELNLYYRRITFEEIIPYWDILWEGRKHFAYSQMQMRGGHAACDHFKFSAFAAVERRVNPKNTYEFTDKIVGVNAGHRSTKGEYRTRGLWVNPEYRGHGIAQRLFQMLEEQAMAEQCRWLWSFPRLSSLPAYMRAGYEPYGTPEKAEYEQNVTAKKDMSILVTYRLFNRNKKNMAHLQSYLNNMEADGYLLGANFDNDLVTLHCINSEYAVHPGRHIIKSELVARHGILDVLNNKQDTQLHVL